VIVLVIAALAIARPGRAPVPSALPTGSGGLIPAATSTAAPATAASDTIDPTPARTPPPPKPVLTPAATVAPRATGDPRLAYAEFLLRVNGDRTTVQRLNAALSTAAQAQDPKAVRTAAVAILDFIDGERDWLRQHPPAACYAGAHAAAGAMLDAYSTAADAFIHWADTGGGLAGLAAFGDALDAAQTAGTALDAFGRTLDSTTCPG